MLRILFLFYSMLKGLTPETLVIDGGAKLFFILCAFVSVVAVILSFIKIFRGREEQKRHSLYNMNEKCRHTQVAGHKFSANR